MILTVFKQLEKTIGDRSKLLDFPFYESEFWIYDLNRAISKTEKNNQNTEIITKPKQMKRRRIVLHLQRMKEITVERKSAERKIGIGIGLGYY